MPIKYFRNKETDEVIRKLKNFDELDPEIWEEFIEAPNSKFMEGGNKGKSKIKDQDAILKARARNYARENDFADVYHKQRANGMDKSAKKHLLNAKGLKKRKIDDL